MEEEKITTTLSSDCIKTQKKPGMGKQHFLCVDGGVMSFFILFLKKFNSRLRRETWHRGFMSGDRIAVKP